MKINEICTARKMAVLISYRGKCNNSSSRFAPSFDRFDSWSLHVKNRCTGLLFLFIHIFIDALHSTAPIGFMNEFFEI